MQIKSTHSDAAKDHSHALFCSADQKAALCSAVSEVVMNSLALKVITNGFQTNLSNLSGLC
jgi:hypothetical protein